MDVLEKIDKLLFYINHQHFNQWRKHGFDYRHYIKFTQSWLMKYDFETVFDIGANIGQAAIAMALAYPKATIHSFEPIPECFTELNAVSKKLDRIVPHNYALGSNSGEVTFEQNGYSASSSLLKIADNHVKHFPHTNATFNTTVPIIRLDDYLDKVVIKGRALMKIDVQGFEDQVLLGATSTLRNVDVLIVETSFEELYDQQVLFNKIYAQVTDLGFVYAGSFDQLTSPVTGKILQQDAIFVRY